MTETPDRQDDGLAGLPRSHDAYFKAMLQWPSLRADLVRGLLPPGVQPLLAAGAPTLADKDFQGATLQERRADALLKVPLVGAPPEDCLFLLLEHKSKPAPNIHAQLVGYHAALVEQQEVAYEKEPPGRRQRPVVKWVIYNGREKWRIPRRSSQQVGRHPALAEAAAASFASGYELLDLRQTPVEHLASGFPRIRAFLLALRGSLSERELAWRRRKRPELWQQSEPPLEELLSLVAEGIKEAPEHVKQQHLCYIMSSKHWTQHVEKATILDRVAKPLFGDEEGETKMLSLLERHEQAAMAQGKAELLIQQLEHQYGILPDWTATRIGQAKANEISIWAERLLEARSIEAVFDDSPLPRRTRLNGEP